MVSDNLFSNNDQMNAYYLFIYFLLILLSDLHLNSTFN